MKLRIASALFFLYCSVTMYAQPPVSDTLFGGLGHLAPYLRSIYEADVLAGRSTPQLINPVRQKICFDKIIKIESIANGETVITCVFLNTTTGVTAHGLPQKRDPGFCDIKSEDPDFVFEVNSMKGNTYTYRNRENNHGGIDHWVQTSNSETYQYQFTGSGVPRTTLRRKAERRSYCDNKVEGLLYKVDGRPEEWFLFGKTYPEFLVMQEKKFLGSMGVGYQYSDKGLFIILQMTGGGFNSRILDIRDQQICFDPAPFKIFEDKQQTEVNTSITRERESIQRDAAEPEQYPGCQQKKEALLLFRKQAVDKRERNNQQVRRGNAQQNEATIKAQAELMNYDDMLEQLRLETELKYCRAVNEQSERPSADLQKEINCLNTQLQAIHHTQIKFGEIDNRYRRPDQVNIRKMEKSTQFLHVLRPCD